MVSYCLAATQDHLDGATWPVIRHRVRAFERNWDTVSKAHRSYPRTPPELREPTTIIDRALDWTVAVMTSTLNSVRSAEWKKVFRNTLSISSHQHTGVYTEA